MNEYEWYEARGIDSDMRACFEHNYVNMDIKDIKKVVAVWEGENDGDNWRWIAQINQYHHDDYVFIEAGCDYTGWDCQSWVHIQIYGDFDTCIPVAMSYLMSQNRNDVVDSLLNQLSVGKNKTWRENMDKLLNINSSNIIDIPKKK